MTTHVHIISHNDLDGVGSAMLLTYGFNSSLDYSVTHNYMVGNHKVDEAIRQSVTDALEMQSNGLDNHLIVMSDVSPSEGVAEYIDCIATVNSGIEIVLLDHHKTALELNRYDWSNVLIEADGVKQSGTSLVVDFLFSLDLKLEPVWMDFAEQVRSYDTWDWFSEGKELPKKLNDLLYIIGYKPFFVEMTQYLSDYKESALTLPSHYETILEIEGRRIDAYVDKKEKQLVLREMSIIHENEIRKATLGVVFAEQYQSELGNRLCERNPHVDLVAMVDLGSRKVSLRTASDLVDVSVIAKANGGGGHPKASGFPLTAETFAEYVSLDTVPVG